MNPPLTRVKEHCQGPSAIGSHMDDCNVCTEKVSSESFVIINSSQTEFDITIIKALKSLCTSSHTDPCSTSNYIATVHLLYSISFDIFSMHNSYLLIHIKFHVWYLIHTLYKLQYHSRVGLLVYFNTSCQNFHSWRGLRDGGEIYRSLLLQLYLLCCLELWLNPAIGICSFI